MRVQLWYSSNESRDCRHSHVFERKCHFAWKTHRKEAYLPAFRWWPFGKVFNIYFPFFFFFPGLYKLFCYDNDSFIGYSCGFPCNICISSLCDEEFDKDVQVEQRKNIFSPPFLKQLLFIDFCVFFFMFYKKTNFLNIINVMFPHA